MTNTQGLMILYGGVLFVAGGLTYLGIEVSKAGVKITEDREKECNLKDGTYLRHENVCVDLNTIRLGGDTAHLHAVIYGADFCEPCKDAAAFLIRRHVAFEEKDVQRNVLFEDEMRYFLDMTKQEHGMIPVIVITNHITMHQTVLRGYDRWEVAKAIETETIYQKDDDK